MLTKWLACKKHTSVFIGNEKALLFLLNCSEQQKETLLIHFDFERVLKSCISYFGEENICWEEHCIILTNALFKTKTQIHVQDYQLEIESEPKSGFEDYLLRAHQNWCVFQNEQFLEWKTGGVQNG